MEHMPAQQVMGPAQRSWYLELKWLGTMMFSAVHTARSSLSSAMMTLNKKLTLLPTLCKGVRQQSCSVGYVCSTLLAKPLTELTTIWLDNIMDDVPLGDVTGCSLSVIVPCHGHLANMA
jgi:hypothetical protein